MTPQFGTPDPQAVVRRRRPAPERLADRCRCLRRIDRQDRGDLGAPSANEVGDLVRRGEDDVELIEPGLVEPAFGRVGQPGDRHRVARQVPDVECVGPDDHDVDRRIESRVGRRTGRPGAADAPAEGCQRRGEVSDGLVAERSRPGAPCSLRRRHPPTRGTPRGTAADRPRRRPRPVPGRGPRRPSPHRRRIAARHHGPTGGQLQASDRCPTRRAPPDRSPRPEAVEFAPGALEFRGLRLALGGRLVEQGPTACQFVLDDSEPRLEIPDPLGVVRVGRPHRAAHQLAAGPRPRTRGRCRLPGPCPVPRASLVGDPTRS